MTTWGHSGKHPLDHDLTSRRAVPIPDPLLELGVLRTDDPGQFGVEHLAITTSPADVANANRPSRIAPATSAIATVASNPRPANSPAASDVVSFTTGAFFMGDPSPFQVSLVDPRTLPSQRGTGRDHHLTSTSSGTTSWRSIG
ncbi:hypothetical protein BH24ACT5_BH24ACT5_01850 [soil metagenome]